MKHGFTVQIRWLTLIHFSLRRSGDSNLTFLTGREMGGMTQEITHGCTSKVWSALTLRFPKGSVLFQRRVGGWNKTVLCYLCYHSTFPTHPPHSRCKTKDEHTSFKIDMHCFTCEQILHWHVTLTSVNITGVFVSVCATYFFLKNIRRNCVHMQNTNGHMHSTFKHIKSNVSSATVCAFGDISKHKRL